MTNDQGPASDVTKADAPTGEEAAPNEANGSVATNEAGLSNVSNADSDGESAVDGNTVPADMNDLHADYDHLAAVTSLPPDVLSSVDHALDQLTTSVDLFDVACLDFDGPSQT